MSYILQILRREIDGLLRREIDGIVKETLARKIESPAFGSAILRICQSHPRWVFIAAMRDVFRRVDPALTPKAAFIIGRNVLNAFLEDNKIEFGDTDYDWTAAGAETLAHEMEIDHWESRA